MQYLDLSTGRKHFKRNHATGLAGLAFILSVISAAAQLIVTTTNLQGGLPLTPTWSPASGSLIAGLVPSSSAGNFSLEATGRSVNSLTAGGSLTIGQIAGNTTSTNYITCGNGNGAGSLVIYTLPASTNGYDLTNITVYGGWKDNGRDAQAYTVSYSTAANPGTFTVLTSINYNPSVPSGTASATRVTIADAAGGLISSHVASVKFDFTTPVSENGYTGYGAITVQGAATGPVTGPPTTPPPSESPANASLGVAPGTTVTLTASATGSTPIGYQWQTDNGSGGALANIPGATNSTLVVSTTGLAFGAYQYDYVASNSFGTNTSPTAAVRLVAMVDIGAGAPTPGPQDISQLLNTAQSDGVFNYYTDNGASYGNWCGQTFTTGTNQNGYLLQTLAWKSAGNGNSFGSSQLYDLYFYSISADGSRAALIANYQGNGGGVENDWFQWRGLSVPLAPNHVYAYAFGRDASASGWEHIANQGGNLYPGGQTMTIANPTGSATVTYDPTGASDATFDLGLIAYSLAAPRAVAPTFTPDSTPIYAGGTTAVTFNEVALGTAPFSYQWLTDNGGGGALVPINGAVSSNLLVDTTARPAGNYNYAVTVANAFGTSTSATVTLYILPASPPVVLTDITPAPANQGNIGQTVTYSATFAGTPPLSYQWNVDKGSGFTPIPVAANPSAISNTLVITNLQLTNAGIYSLTAQNNVGNTPSSASTLVIPTPNGAPLSVTLPPVTLSLASSNAGSANLTWAQGALLQAADLSGPWTTNAATVEATNVTVSTTNATTFYKVAVTNQPRIVNLYCFVRDQDFRTANSQQVLYQTTVQQLQLFKQANLPATFALQYDALMDTNYQALFKQQLGSNDELAAWWEIPQELVEAAGLVWRGAQEWDPTANVDFSCGYSPAERIKLVDTYMAGFKSIFGYYPKTVGSWYIDEVTLSYMATNYGVVASCNCKDQIGTDSYTIWGSYWNQAYYPSLLNAYMPAQTRAGQINLPIFRMLGSDPIYQYGISGVITLEPVYPNAGGSADWVAWFMNNLVMQPSLAFAYAQAGQENDIDGGWNSQGPGLTRQVALFAAQAQAGQIQVQTLATTGQWFRNHFSVTPPTSIVALDDWQNQNRKTVWYNSRYYRLNVLWQSGGFFIRDLHCFDENVSSGTHTNGLTSPNFDLETLPVMDGGMWSGSGTNAVGMWPVLVATNGTTSNLTASGAPVVMETSPTDLNIQQSLGGGGILSMACSESNLTVSGVDAQGQPLHWALNLIGGAQQQATVQTVSSTSVAYQFNGVNYQLQVAPGTGNCVQMGNGDIRITPNSAGKLVLLLDVNP